MIDRVFLLDPAFARAWMLAGTSCVIAKIEARRTTGQSTSCF